MIKVDGSYGEGGGQILRTSIALSCITGEPVEIYNIRANRPKPGLAMQHLKGIECAKKLTNADVEGLRLGSTRVVFKPRSVRSGDFKIDIGTAGSISLILQTILLPSLIAEGEIFFEIRGGTDVKWSPSIDYLRNVTFKTLKEIGANIDIELIKRGYYPKGGGIVNVFVHPSKLKGKEFEEIRCSIEGISHCQNLPKHVAERQANSALSVLNSSGFSADIKIEVCEGFSTGSGITLWCGYKGGVALGEKGKRAEEVGEECARNLIRELRCDGIFDRYLADQIMVFASVAKGITRYTTTEVTLHQTSNAYVIQKFLGDIIKIDGKKIEIKGKGILS